MDQLTLDLPAMYGDHHVTEVRGLLAALPGVTSIYASSAWRQVRVEYDAGQTTPAAIREALRARGYASDDAGLPPVAARSRAQAELAPGPGAGEQFVERVPAWEAALGPCPGFEIRQPGEVHPADRERRPEGG